MSVTLLNAGLAFGIAAILALALFLLLLFRPRAGITLLLVVVVLDGSREWALPLNLELAGINVIATDVVAVALAAVAALRVDKMSASLPVRAALLALTTLSMLGLMSWILAEGLESGFNTWRAWGLGLAAVWYALSWPELKSAHGLQPFVWAAFLASFFQAAGIALHGFGSSSDTVLVDGEFLNSRPLSASVALLMLVGLVILWFSPAKPSVYRWLGIGWLFLSVVLAQHRSVWVAALLFVGLATYSVIRRSERRLLTATAGAALVTIGLVAVAATMRTQQQLSSSASNTDTFEWRIDNWTEKLTTARPPWEWLVGSTFGPTYLTDPASDGVRFKLEAHNMVVDMITWIGLVGLLLIIVVVVSTLRTRSSIATDGMFTVPIMALLGYSFFYSWPAWTWIIVGIALQSRPPSSRSREGDANLLATAHHDSSARSLGHAPHVVAQP